MLNRTTENAALQRGLTEFLSYRIVRLHHALNSQATARVDEIAGVSLLQWRAFVMVGSGTARTSRDLSNKSMIDPAIISQTVRALKVDGIMETLRADVDRRVLELHLTAKGEDIYQRTFPHMQARQAALMDVLDPGEQDMVFGILDKLEEAAE